MMKKYHKNNLSIRKLLILTFILTLMITVGTVTFLNFYSWKNSIDKTIEEIEYEMNASIFNEIDNMIQTPLIMNETNHYMIQNGSIDLQNPKERDPFFAGILRSSSNEIYSISYGSENGDYYGARRNSDNKLELYQCNKDTKGHSFYYSVDENLLANGFLEDYGAFDPRSRAWYKNAKEMREPIFAPLYKHFVKSDLVLTAAYPIYEGDTLKGVLGTHITLEKLNTYLNDIVSKRMGDAFIIEANSGNLVANSLKLSNFESLLDGTYERIQLTNMPDISVQKAYQDYLDESKNKQVIEKDNETVHIKISEYNQYGLHWLIITSLPEKVFQKDMNRQLATSTILLAISILVSIIIYINITSSLLKPVNDLVDVTDRFSEGDLSQRAKVYRNDEIGKIARSYNHMADELQSYINGLEEKVEMRTEELKYAISKLKDSNSELINAKENAESANIAKSQFLANMSHEIRTPMNGILGFLQLLEISSLDDEQKEHIEMIKSSFDSLLIVINDILDISKIEAGMLKIERIPFHLRSAIETSVTLFGTRAKEKGVELNLLISSNVPNYVIGDPTRIRQILNNLISNAVKFTNQGEIFVDVSLQSEVLDEIQVLFMVKDTGIGMNKEDVQKLFIPFSQVDASTTREYGGTGLGLSICRRIVDLMGGEIDVRSSKGEGSIFSFSIPLVKIEETTTVALPDYSILDCIATVLGEKINMSSVRTDSEIIARHKIRESKYDSKLKILLVEDNMINKKFFIKLLNKYNLFCDVAINGEEAVSACSFKEYDLVFMDCQMPVLDGFEATRRIRKMEGDQKHTIIIAMTAFAMKGDVENCIDAGMDDYLSKPVKTEQVLDIITKYSDKIITSNSSNQDTHYFEQVVTALMKETDFNRSDSEEIVHEFYEFALKTIEKVKKYLEDGNITDTKLYLHQLKGTSANIRAKEIALLTSEIEAKLVVENIKQIIKELEGIKTMVQKLRVEKNEVS